MKALEDQGARDIIVFAGGVIPAQDYDYLFNAGAKAIFAIQYRDNGGSFDAAVMRGLNQRGFDIMTKGAVGYIIGRRRAAQNIALPAPIKRPAFHAGPARQAR